jgi:hypothetical protein
MSRHETIAYPRKWVEPTGLGDNYVPGYWVESYQEDIPFTVEEEAIQDTIDAEGLIAKSKRRVENIALEEAVVTGIAKLKAVGLTDLEIKALTKHSLE